MNTLKTPSNMKEFNVAGAVYVADEDGHVHVDNPDHIETLKRFGCFDPVTEADPEAVASDAPASDPVSDAEREEFALTKRQLDVAVSQVAERDEILDRIKNDHLRIVDALHENGHDIADGETVADAIVRVLGTPAATDTADTASDASGGTSEKQEDAAGAGDAGKLVRPAEDSTRDDLVEWLNTNRVEGAEDVSPSISKANAWLAVDALLAAKA